MDWLRHAEVLLREAARIAGPESTQLPGRDLILRGGRKPLSFGVYREAMDSMTVRGLVRVEASRGTFVDPGAATCIGDLLDVIERMQLPPSRHPPRPRPRPRMYFGRKQAQPQAAR